MEIATRAIATRVLAWIAILTAILALYPVEYRFTRLTLLLGLTATWTGGLFLWWNRRLIRISLLVIGLLPTAITCLPGRPVAVEQLSKDYSRTLRMYQGVRYVWGGEGLLGIDCSGLVRKGLVWSQLNLGIRTLNGKPIRDAIALWWQDCSAMALRDGYEEWTTELFRSSRIAEAETSRLQPGDLAVTADGVHVMAYLGGKTWIEADPDAHRVIEVDVPTDNSWFHTDVVFVRWKWLAQPQAHPE